MIRVGDKFKHINGCIYTVEELKENKIILKNCEENKTTKVGLDFFESTVETEGGIIIGKRFVKIE